MIRVPRSILRTAAIALVATLSLLAAVAPANAGCLREYGNCGDCARAAIWRAIFDFEFEDATDAWVDGIDCDIDLLHCLLYDNHHEYCNA